MENWNRDSIGTISEWDESRTKLWVIESPIPISLFEYDLIKPKFKLNSEIISADEITELRAINETKKIDDEINVIKSVCMFNWEEIKEWVSIDAYKNKTRDYPAACSNSDNKETRTCDWEWNLSWTFAYPECTAPTQCEWWINPSHYKNSVENFANLRKKCKSNLTFEPVEFVDCITDHSRIIGTNKCEPIIPMCDIWNADLVGMWTEVGSECIYEVPLESGEWTKEFDIGNDEYLVKVNWIEINLLTWKQYWDELEIYYKPATKIFIIQNDDYNIYQDVTILNKIEIYKAPSAWAGWTPTVHLWCWDCPFWQDTEHHTAFFWTIHTSSCIKYCKGITTADWWRVYCEKKPRWTYLNWTY